MKKNRTIYDTPICQSANVSKVIKDTMSFLIKNRLTVTVSDLDLSRIRDINVFSTTPMYELYSKIIDENNFKEFTMLNFNNQVNNIPEVLTRADISIDARYLDTNVPKELKTGWINLSPILSKKPSDRHHLTITDNASLHSLVVRMFLTMSYHDSKGDWLSPKLSAFVIESYIIVLSRLITRSYNLSFEEDMMIKTVFAYHYASLMTTQFVKSGGYQIPSLLSRMSVLGNLGDIFSRVEAFTEYIPKDRHMTFYDVMDIIRQVGPDRVSNLKTDMVYRLFSSGTMQSTAQLIATDHPAYFVWILLKQASGIKNPMLHSIFKSTRLDQRLKDFTTELLMTKSLKVKM